MAWRGLHLSRPARLTLADTQIVVAQDDGDVRLPLEDVAWIVIDTPQATITTALLAACMDAGVAVILCDATHLPNGIALPFHRHHRQGAVAACQAATSRPLRKRLWQAMVQAKIRNQAAALRIVGGSGDALDAMAARVCSGDPDNLEAQAARRYWRALFPDFTRESASDRRSAMLNYGYAVLRGVIARNLVAAGLLPVFGIGHASGANAFNLADDLIEPFRPVVDYLVWELSESGCTKEGPLTLEHRRRLATAPLMPVLMGSEEVTLLIAGERAATSLVAAMESGSAAVLQLPRLQSRPFRDGG